VVPSTTVRRLVATSGVGSCVWSQLAGSSGFGWQHSRPVHGRVAEEVSSRDLHSGPSVSGGGGHLPFAWWPCAALVRESGGLGIGCIGSRARSVLVLGRSSGLRTPARKETSRGFQFLPVATPVRIPRDLFVAAVVLAGIDTRRWETLNTRRKGMRGRPRWFTPSRPACGPKTAKIGKGHGGSTQPIRVLGPRVAHSAATANVMRGRGVDVRVGDAPNVLGSSKGTHL
jgi:hypothetical protein